MLQIIVSEVESEVYTPEWQKPYLTKDGTTPAAPTELPAFNANVTIRPTFGPALPHDVYRPIHRNFPVDNELVHYLPYVGGDGRRDQFMYEAEQLIKYAEGMDQNDYDLGKLMDPKEVCRWQLFS